MEDKIPPMEQLIRKIEGNTSREELVARYGEEMVKEAESFLE